MKEEKGMFGGNPETSKPTGPIFEPGPGWGNKIVNWFSRYLWRVIVPVIAVIIVAIGITGLLRNNEAGEIMQEEKEELGFKIDEETGKLIFDEENKPSTEITEITKTEGTIKINALKGEGITHLARRVIKEYLNDNPDPEIKAEHKIFTEDYLKDKEGTRLLEIGEELEFTTTDIMTAIEKSKALSEKELENLSKYVPLVRGL